MTKASGGTAIGDVAFSAELSPTLPRLAWLCRVDAHAGDVHVMHGRGVETGPNYIVEGAWDATFEESRFHTAEHFFGSGVRVSSDGIWLVPSSASVDRLAYVRGSGGTLLASNSLALLLGSIRARLVPGHDYQPQTRAFRAGLSCPVIDFPIEHAGFETVQLLMHRSLVIRGEDVDLSAPGATRKFSSFEEYFEALQGVLSRIEKNLSSSHRRFRVASYSTTSTGYDSVAITALVSRLGVTESFTARGRDDGSEIIRRLGMIPHRVSVSGPGEASVYAPCEEGAQLQFVGVAALVEGNEVSAIYTGYHGDKVWDLQTTGEYLSDEIRRGDASGLDLTELRLQAGFINIPVPFIFARSIRSLVDLSKSVDMAQWRLGTPYDRPIPRRIAEEAGVPREDFGNRKRALVERPPLPVDSRLRKEFLKHLRERRGYSPLFVRAHIITNSITHRLLLRLDRIRGRARFRSGVVVRKDVRLWNELHLWALQRLADAHAAATPAICRFADRFVIRE